MIQAHARWLVLALMLSACGGDEVANNAACPEGTELNPIVKECVRLSSNNANNLPVVEMGAIDGPDMRSDNEDLGVDLGPPDLGCQTDEDGDGALSMECGGDDCDDTDGRRAPHLAERCDEVDNNCDGALNEGLSCSILAHSSTRLYRVDFFAGTFVDLGPTIGDLYDIDTHPDGTTYGIAGNKLYSYSETTGGWTPKAGSLGFLDTPNGFCIDNEGKAFATAGYTLLSVDLTTGTSTSIGSLSPTSSSGDCVVNKGNQLFMTSNHTEPDSFASINGDTAMARVVGATQHDQIWGLTAAYSRVFGLTFTGDVVEINVMTGATTLIRSYPEISFYGAASTPLR